MERVTTLCRPVIRILRRKTVLALIFCLSFAYCMTSLYYGHRNVSSSSSSYQSVVDYGEGEVGGGGGGKHLGFRRGGLKEEDAGGGAAGGMIPLLVPGDPHDSHDRRVQYFQDILDYNSNQSNEGGDKGKAGKETCRNSVQGKVLIADDNGFICQRKDVSASGCCDESSGNTKRYSCDTCNGNHCCAIYEYCISCCLHPNQKELLSSVIHGRTPASPPLVSNVVAASLTDHFDFCLAKCRTSSHSVQHENSYRDPKAKHCYGAPLLEKETTS